MSKVAIINPTTSPVYAKSTKSLRERLGKYKHRPVFYSKSQERLGARSEHALLNKSKRSASKMAAKKRKTKPGFRSATKKRSNPVRKGSYKAKRGYGFRRRRRNPETAGSLSMGNVGNALMGVGGAIVGYKFGTGLLGLQGNGKYIGGAIMTVGGYWLLEKIWPALAMPFGIAMGTLVVKDYLDESGVLDGLGSLLGIGGEMTEQDYNMLQEWNSGLGLIPGSSVQTMPVPQMPAGMEGSPRVANRSF